MKMGKIVWKFFDKYKLILQLHALDEGGFLKNSNHWVQNEWFFKSVEFFKNANLYSLFFITNKT